MSVHLPIQNKAIYVGDKIKVCQKGFGHIEGVIEEIIPCYSTCCASKIKIKVKSTNAPVINRWCMNNHVTIEYYSALVKINKVGEV